MPRPAEDGDVTRPKGWDSLPADVQATLAGADLPATFLVRDTGANFIFGPDVAEVDDATLGRLVRFGHSTVGFHGHFCLSPATGEVRLVMPDIPSLFVNSSVDQFASTMRLFRRFEREVTTGDADDCESAVAQIRDELKRLDEPAAHPDSYWGSIGYDMEAGYYSDNPDF